MRQTIIFTLACCGMLAACGGEAQDAPTDGKSLAEVAREAGDLNKPMPGKYRSTVKLIEFEIPGIPPKQAEQMRGMMAGVEKQANEYCLSADEVQDGWEEMTRKMNRAADGADCKFDRFSADGGNLDAQMSCTGDRGVGAQIAMTGVMTPEKQVMVMKMKQSGSQMPGGAVNMTMEVTNERLGDCT
ncbi:DUF3617 domain-containing protein [Altererythrobacter aquiaggeris]|uniref:DUF3617 domain-containing protein n=1 Tax=Aestuarierythrobacter aquiaggeris TaxID=1898396 RepID=UPI003019D2F7